MEIRANTEYISSIFAMQNPKVEKRKVFEHGGITTLFVDSYLGKDKTLKVYYDTPEGTFANLGVNIYTIESRVKRIESLHVSLKTDVSRHMFLSDMPTYFRMDIHPGDRVTRYAEFIAESIYKIFPNGIEADAKYLAMKLKPIMFVEKDREQFRLYNNDGLKVILSFDKVVYRNLKNKMTDKSRQLEVSLQSAISRSDYDDFIRRLSLQVPTLVPMKEYDIDNALERTNFERKR